MSKNKRNGIYPYILAKVAQKRAFLRDFGLFITLIADFATSLRRILPSKTFGKNKAFRSFDENIVASEGMVRFCQNSLPVGRRPSWTATEARRVGDAADFPVLTFSVPPVSVRTHFRPLTTIHYPLSTSLCLRVRNFCALYTVRLSRHLRLSDFSRIVVSRIAGST